jgi:hypothetical protein
LRDSTADLGAGGIVRGCSEIFNLDVEGTKVRDQSIFERCAEVIGSGNDFDMVVRICHE